MAPGSGFIVDPAGYVVTNNHVIQNADKIQVTLTDGRKLDAKLVGRDDKTDVAVLKVESSEPLPYVKWGDSDKARVGDWVIAVGNPFGLGGTVTAGIISARGRDIQSGPFDDYLQIDASINRGNSGGPSFDRNGEVIGRVRGQRVEQSRDVARLVAAAGPNKTVELGVWRNGKQVPVQVALGRMPTDQTASADEGNAPTSQQAEPAKPASVMGLSLAPVNKQARQRFDLPENAKGALIVDVKNGSPAADAGFSSGDIIVKVGDKQVSGPRDVVDTVQNAAKEKRKAVLFLIQRGDNQRFVALPLTKSTS